MSHGWRGLSWDGKAPRLLVALAVLATLGSPGEASSEATVGVIVREHHPASTAAETLVTSLGGTIDAPLALIGGFIATVPADTLDILAADPTVAAVTPDGRVRLLGTLFGENTEAAGYDGSMPHVLRTIGAERFWGDGYNGTGVDVALIDSGVVGVEGLTASVSGQQKVVNGADLSFESQSTSFRYLDTYGHGTHMAGIIAGRDSQTPKGLDSVDDRYFTGVAPGARILNVKVGSYDGAVDVSQVIAAIDWVVQHRTDNGMNVRVLNLSFGTDSTQPFTLDPLAFAVEQAWRAGIVVVAAAGNDGNQVPLRNPASDPFVIAVGASNTKGTMSLTDDVVASFSNCSTSGRTVDLLAPGVSVLSLRNPGSFADVAYPPAQVGTRFFKGSGTSQAAAVVSGAAALVLDKYPNATPDQVKALLRSTAFTVKGKLAACYGSGLLDLEAAAGTSLPTVGRAAQTWTRSTGTGTLEGARGSDHLSQNGVTLAGERDIFGKPFSTVSWAPLAAAGSSWSGGTWNGTTWSGTTWSGTSWSGTAWSGTTWSGISWSGTTWSGTSWSNKTWTGTTWSGTSWSGTSWSGTSWSGTSWSGAGWRGARR
jgi:serine protease AprX